MKLKLSKNVFNVPVRSGILDEMIEDYKFLKRRKVFIKN